MRSTFHPKCNSDHLSRGSTSFCDALFPGRAVKAASKDENRSVSLSEVPFFSCQDFFRILQSAERVFCTTVLPIYFHLIRTLASGKDPPKDIQGTRPAVRIHSARCQEVLNKWFESSSDGQPRPDWFQSKHKAKQREGGPDAGEWKLIWHPRSRMDSPTVRIVPDIAAVTMSSYTDVMLLFSALDACDLGTVGKDASHHIYMLSMPIPSLPCFTVS